MLLLKTQLQLPCWTNWCMHGNGHLWESKISLGRGFKGSDWKPFSTTPSFSTLDGMGVFLPIVWSIPTLPRMARTAWGDFVALPTLSLLLITAETTQDSCILLGAGNEILEYCLLVNLSALAYLDSFDPPKTTKHLQTVVSKISHFGIRMR